MIPDHDTLESLADFMDSQAVFHDVFCRRCDWESRAWLEREAEIRGQVHEAQQDDHRTEIQPVALIDQQVEGLGLTGQ